MFSKKILVITVVLVTLFAACSKKGSLSTKYIPNNAAVVAIVDIKSLTGKLEKDGLTLDSLMSVVKQHASEKDYTKALNYLTKFKNAGLDLDAKVYLASINEDITKGAGAFEFVVKLKDQKKFEEFIKGLEEKPEIKKGENYSYIEQGEASLGWNNEVCILSIKPETHSYDYFDEETSPKTTAAKTNELAKYFSLKKETSLESNKQFSEAESAKGDIIVYSSSDSFIANTKEIAAMKGVKELLTGIYSVSTINFENGKIVAEGNTFVGSKLGSLLSKYGSSKIDNSLVENFPGSNVQGFFATGFNPELIPALLKEAELLSLANAFMSQQGLTVEDITKAFKGDITFVTGDIKFTQTEKASPYTGEMRKSIDPELNFVFAVRIGDKAAFNKLIDMGSQMGIYKRNGDNFELSNAGEEGMAGKIAMGIKDDLFIVAKDKATFDQYVAKSGKAVVPADAKKALDGSVVSYFVDANGIMNGYSETYFDSTEVTEKNIFVASKNVFKTLWFNSEKFSGNKMKSKGELTLKEGKNSLSVLVEYAKYVAEQFKIKQDAYHSVEDVYLDEAVPADSTTPVVIAE